MTDRRPVDHGDVDEMLDALGLDAQEQAALTADVDEPAAGGGTDDGVDPDEQGRCGCRYCQQEFREAARAREHINWCGAAPERLRDGSHDVDDELETDDELLDQLDSEAVARQDEYLIRTAPHEFRVFLKYGAGGLDPYYALHAKRKAYDDWGDGGPTATYEYNGRRFEVELTYNPDNPILPWDDESFQIEEVYEYRISVSGPNDHRSFSAKISPRWPDMETAEGSPSISNPRDFVGLDIDLQGSNIPFEVYPEHIEAAMQALDVAGEYQDGGTRSYYDPATIEDWSTIVDADLYVRLYDEQSGSVYAIDGPLERISMLLADDRSGYRKRIADDTETEGYYHVATIGSKRARHLISGHRLGKEIKHYHVENPDAVAGDGMLEHPKVGVSFQHSQTDSTVYWADLDELTRELDETLLNVLKWAGIPTTPRSDYYVEDAIFKVRAERRERRLLPNPLPAIQTDQEVRVIRQLDNMVASDKDVVATVLSDGGEVSPQDVAEQTGWTYDTVLASLERLDGVLAHEYGEISVQSVHIAQQLVDHVTAIRDGVQRQLDGIGQQLQRAIAGFEDPDNPFRRWAEKYGIDVEDHDEDPRILMRMGYLPADSSELREIIQEGRTALRRTLGETTADDSRLARWGEVQATLQTGESILHKGFG